MTDLAGPRINAEDFLAAVLQAAAQPIWVVDPAGLIRFANPAAVAALGYDVASELLGRHSHETIHYKHPDGSPYPASECPMLLPRLTGETIARDLDWFFRRDGSMFPVSYVSVPLDMPGGRGAVVAFTDVEESMRAEQVLRDHDAVLAAQQESLRRVAALVAGGAASAEVFAAIAREVAHVLGLPMVEMMRYERDGTATVLGAWSEGTHPFQTGDGWPLDGPASAALVKRTGRPARVDDFAGVPGAIAAAARQAGIRSGAGAPIVVDGDVWGVIATGGTDGRPLPDDVEDRLGEFTELVASAISSSASREQLARLAEEQSALRRVATLVARGVPPAELFGAVAREVGLLLGVDATHLGRFDVDGAAILIASWSRAGNQIPVGTIAPIDGENVCALVFRSGRPARMDSYDDASGPIAAMLRGLGIRSSVGAPIVVDGRDWGVMIVSSKHDQPLPVDTESRIAAFTELVATAISNTEARTEVRRLAEEQAALRRVATLVAHESSPAEVFAAIAKEAGGLLGVENMRMVRYEAGATVSVVAEWGEPDAAFPVGTRLPLGGKNIASLVFETERPARIDYANATGPIGAHARRMGDRSAVGTPIVVERQLWGVMVATSPEAESLPADTEARLGEFTELLATAISNIEARSDLAASRARVVAAADDERRRVVRDLHDGAQQRLVHTLITLKLAREALQEDDDDSGPRLLDDALEQTERATAELRELAHGILPSVLTRGGLRASVESLASRMPIPVEIGVTVGRLPAAVEATSYFVVAEALTNVAKHSHAEHAAVIARVEDASLYVAVHDDGIGGARPEGSGLLGLGDRLAALDGRLRVESPADGGTRVEATIPLP
jgi:PAS domain S-box-containing protein